MKPTVVLFLLLPLLLPFPALAGPDDFLCDTVIYGGETAQVRPNLLIFLDTSASMQERVPVTLCGGADTGAYDPAVDYTASLTPPFCGQSLPGGAFNLLCRRQAVYECSSLTDGLCTHWREMGLAVGDLPCSDIRGALLSGGHWVGRRRIAGSAGCEATGHSQVYATGNWIVWQKTGGSDCTSRQEPRIAIARQALKSLVQGLQGVDIGLMVFGPADAGGRGGLDAGRFAEEVVAGRKYIAEIKAMEAIHAGTITNRQALLTVIDALTASDQTGSPLAETLFEAMRYFRGETTAFNAHAYPSDYARPYLSPIAARCQQNHLLLISDGIPADAPHPLLPSICAEMGQGGCHAAEPDAATLLVDLAAYLHRSDLSPTYPGLQNLRTFTIGFGGGGGDSEAGRLLQETAEVGGGEFFLAQNHQELAGALTTALAQVLEKESSFVAPVVPVSPENRTCSGQRVYLALFRPVAAGAWRGNLKKFGIDPSGAILDRSGLPALDDTGRIRPEATSYWSDGADGGQVDRGGAGEKLLRRSPETRQIFTFLEEGDDRLLADRHAFHSANATLLASRMGVSAEAAEAVIGHLRGRDAGDEDRDGDTAETRQWLLGDILHSRPLVLHYAPFPAGQEADPVANRTLILVGSNDGQLHAFADTDGEELWSFIPPAVLPNLPSLVRGDRLYAVDSSPTAYVHDRNRDGRIDPGEDRVILLLGLRRGGGIDRLAAAGSRGAYYALDISDPADPRFLWELDGSTPGFGELGESWAEPVIDRVRLGGADRIVALIGAGYDNNEDLRFGDTQLFPDTTSAATDTTLRSDHARPGAKSSGSSLQVHPRGRGIYVVELARLDANGVPDIHSTPVRLWRYVYDEGRQSSDPANNPAYSFPTSLAAVDSDFDGYLDRLYAGDTGGHLWRFTIGDRTATANWTGRKIFSANAPATDGEAPEAGGRRILYPPSVVLEPGYIGLYFGTGDRAHPLNTSVVDRLYAVYDRDAYGHHPVQPAPITEAVLVDVTGNPLQAADPPRVETCTDTDLDPRCLLQRLFDPRRYGWFIRLEDAAGRGEKALAPALVFNRVAYYTTFTPALAADDPCAVGNLGTGKVYAVHYQTGEAVFNFNPDNDGDGNTNQRALPADQPGVVLDASDRTRSLGEGIPSGVVILLHQDGTSTALFGGGRLGSVPTRKGGTIIPTYWMMR